MLKFQIHILPNCEQIKTNVIEEKYKVLEIHPCKDSTTIKKLAHGYNFIICNELFAIREPILSLVLHEFVVVVNVLFTKLISWLVEPKMHIVMEDFKKWPT